MRGGIRLVALAALGVVAVGCSHDDNASGVSTTTTAKAPWDACTMSPTALQSAGVDPKIIDHGIDGVDLPNSKSCTWSGKDYDIVLTASSKNRTDELHTQFGNNSFTDVTVAGRPGFTFKDRVDKYDNVCFLAIPLETGGIVTVHINRGDTEDRTPTCEIATRVGNILAPEMPR